MVKNLAQPSLACLYGHILGTLAHKGHILAHSLNEGHILLWCPCSRSPVDFVQLDEGEYMVHQNKVHDLGASLDSDLDWVRVRVGSSPNLAMWVMGLAQLVLLWIRHHIGSLLKPMTPPRDVLRLSRSKFTGSEVIYQLIVIERWIRLDRPKTLGR